MKAPNIVNIELDCNKSPFFKCLEPIRKLNAIPSIGNLKDFATFTTIVAILLDIRKKL